MLDKALRDTRYMFDYYQIPTYEADDIDLTELGDGFLVKITKRLTSHMSVSTNYYIQVEFDGTFLAIGSANRGSWKAYSNFLGFLEALYG